MVEWVDANNLPCGYVCLAFFGGYNICSSFNSATSVHNQHTISQAPEMLSPTVIQSQSRIGITRHKIASVKIKVLQTGVSCIRWSEKAFGGTVGGSGPGETDTGKQRLALSCQEPGIEGGNQKARILDWC